MIEIFIQAPILLKILFIGSLIAPIIMLNKKEK
jgi:hypothetical protein